MFYRILFFTFVVIFHCGLSQNLFQEEFIGKCLYYQNSINSEPFVNNPKNCTELWLQFQSAFAFKSLCNVSRDGYRDFVENSQHAIPQNKFIFWEHVYEIVSRYSNRGRRTFAIADTLTGFLGDTKWCSSNTSKYGIEPNRNKCPGYHMTPECPSSAEAAFWTLASEYYAKSAHGDIELMLNADSFPAFSEKSYFAEWELPNLNSSKVTSVKILFAHSSHTQPRDDCSGSSITKLRQILEQRGISRVSCSLNPSALKFQLCSNDPTLPMCTCAKGSSGAASFSHYSVLYLTYIVLLIVLNLNEKILNNTN